MDENKRKWHPEFLKYTEEMVSHPNYQGLYFGRKPDHSVKWVVTGKSELGQKRRNWWNTQCEINGIEIEAGCYQKIALKIHPTKTHVCQICGVKLSLEYVYPNKNTIKFFEREFDVSITPFDKTIFQIIDEKIKTSSDLEKIKIFFKITESKIISNEPLKLYIKKNFVDVFAKGILSPGAMSNSPDRFDGFHSDGACCRHKSDKGRHKSNLQRYGQDRRVYENWADGDWKQADRLMSLFRAHNVSADHIGPISLGFCHRPKFHPLSKEENSAKNNRMSFDDIKVLICDEKKGEQVISWHSRFIWDKLKGKVENNIDAVKLSSLMRYNMHYILIVFSIIDENGYKEFLESFLNPQYSFFDYTFEGFNPETGEYEKVYQKKLTGQNQKNNNDRYYRVAFEKLQEYKEIENRKIHIWENSHIDMEIGNLLLCLKQGSFKSANNKLSVVFSLLSDLGVDQW